MAVQYIRDFFEVTTLYPGGIRPHDPLLVSSVAGGDDTTRPRRQPGVVSILTFMYILTSGH
jgi:hypothetical protein